MHEYRVSDWDGAYANMASVPDGPAWPERWTACAAAFRDGLPAGRSRLDIAYGEAPRQRYDLFLPEGTPAGLAVFVHGGYWMRFDKSCWSHLAAGPLAHGWAVAVPGYTLCPEIRIGGIVREIADAIAQAGAKVAGPVRLAGHSAGGHLVTRMICGASPLPPDVLSRVENTVSISGVHDLRPLMRLALNDTLRLDEAEAVAESPALLRPVEGSRVTCWVGACERSEFVRQNALLANVWRGLGAATAAIEEPDRHHFDVVEGLADPDHSLTRALLDQ